MKYLKKFENNSEDLVRSLTEEEFKYYSSWVKEKITKEEFEKLKSIQDKYYKSEEHVIKYDKDRTHYTLSRPMYPYNKESKTVLPIEITKIGDDWWIVTYVYDLGAFPDDCTYLCDTIDGVEEWFREYI